MAIRKRKKYLFRLYVTGEAPNSLMAISNLQAICGQFLHGRHEIEVIDTLIHPERASRDNILITPMAVRVSPGPKRRIIGNLSEKEAVLQTFGLDGVATNEAQPWRSTNVLTTG